MARLAIIAFLHIFLWPFVVATNSTTISELSGSICPTKACRTTRPAGRRLYWMTFEPTSMVVAATVRILVNNATNSTTTTTIFNTLPAGVEYPPTNEAGTQITVVTSFASSAPLVTIAYPTVWEDYDSLVSWHGTLSTKGTCKTVDLASQSTITLPPHPPISVAPSPPLPSYDPNDPKGYRYFPFIGDVVANISSYATQLDEMALVSCGWGEHLPLAAMQGIELFTETETAWDTSLPDAPASTSAAEVTAEPSQPLSFTGAQPSAPAALQSSAVLKNSDNSFNIPSTPTPPTAPTPSVIITVGDIPVTAEPEKSQLVVGSQTLTPGGTIIVLGTTVELNPTAPIVVVNGETSTIEALKPTPSGSTPTSAEAPEFSGAAARFGAKLRAGIAIALGWIALEGHMF